MTHDPDMQKEAIIAHQKREKARSFKELSLADRFESILYAPDYTAGRRGELLMHFAWNNRHEIEAALRSRDAESATS